MNQQVVKDTTLFKLTTEPGISQNAGNIYYIWVKIQKAGQNTLKFVINTVPCNMALDTKRSRRGPAFPLPAYGHENENKSPIISYF